MTEPGARHGESSVAGAALVALLLAGCVVRPQPAPYGAPPPQGTYGGPPGAYPVQPQGPYASQGPYGAPPEASCRLGSDGYQACGYDCKVGADGMAACAPTPDGRCAMGADGHVYCSQAAPQRPAYGGPPPECELNSDGSRSCGYNCRLGSNGYHYCASTPNGRCALNSDGSFTCT